ncbi:uncharacterized protein LOC120542463 isoform X2 [Polypterus senegalus]|nr:uncharacterized protein LOC120542463 isoform X2 [Polypterus senegalus]
MQRMIRQFAAEYTSKTSSPQDSIQPNGTKDQSLPKTSSFAPAENPVLSKLLMADQDSPLDLTVKKVETESSDQDGVLDLSTKRSPSTGCTFSNTPPNYSSAFLGKGDSEGLNLSQGGQEQPHSSLQQFMTKLCSHHQKQFVNALDFLQAEVQPVLPSTSSQSLKKESPSAMTEMHFDQGNKFLKSSTFTDSHHPDRTPVNIDRSHDTADFTSAVNISDGQSLLTNVPEGSPSNLSSGMFSQCSVDQPSPSDASSNHKPLFSSQVEWVQGGATLHKFEARTSLTSQAANIVNTPLQNPEMDTCYIDGNLDDLQHNLDTSSCLSTNSTLENLGAVLSLTNQSLHNFHLEKKHSSGDTKDLILESNPAERATKASFQKSTSPVLTKTVRKNSNSGHYLRPRNSLYQIVNDLDNQCDIVYISKHITECQLEPKKSVSLRENARKSTRGHRCNEEYWELKTVRTLVQKSVANGKGNWPPLIPESINLVAPKQPLSVPESDPLTNSLFSGTHGEVPQENNPSEQTMIKKVKEKSFTVDGYVEAIAETNQTNQVKLSEIVSYPSQACESSIDQESENCNENQNINISSAKQQAVSTLTETEHPIQELPKEHHNKQVESISELLGMSASQSQSIPALERDFKDNLVDVLPVESGESSINVTNLHFSEEISATTKLQEEESFIQPLLLKAAATAQPLSLEEEGEEEEVAMTRAQLLSPEENASSQPLPPKNNENAVAQLLSLGEEKTNEGPVRPLSLKHGAKVVTAQLLSLEEEIKEVTGLPLSLEKEIQEANVQPLLLEKRAEKEVTDGPLLYEEKLDETTGQSQSHEEGPTASPLFPPEEENELTTGQLSLSEEETEQATSHLLLPPENVVTTTPVLLKDHSSSPHDSESVGTLDIQLQVGNSSEMQKPEVVLNDYSLPPIEGITENESTQKYNQKNLSCVFKNEDIDDVSVDFTKKRQDQLEETEEKKAQNAKKLNPKKRSRKVFEISDRSLRSQHQALIPISISKMKNVLPGTHTMSCLEINPSQSNRAKRPCRMVNIKSPKVVNLEINNCIEDVNDDGAQKAIPLSQVQTSTERKVDIPDESENLSPVKSKIPGITFSESASRILENCSKMHSVKDSNDCVGSAGRKSNKTLIKNMASRVLTKHKHFVLRSYSQQGYAVSQVTTRSGIYPQNHNKPLRSSSGNNPQYKSKNLELFSIKNTDISAKDPPRFLESLVEEENQDLLTSLNAKYEKVHKGWVQLEREVQPSPKPKSKADRLKEIWKSKRRIRRSKALEQQKLSPVQMLFMKTFSFANICRWFLETTETRSLVIVKKINTRLASETQPFFHNPSSIVTSSSTTTFTSLQAERLKKHLKKFAMASPAKNNLKTLKQLAKSRQLNGQINCQNETITATRISTKPRANPIPTTGTARKQSQASKSPASARILRKYSNIRGKLQVSHHVLKTETSAGLFSKTGSPKSLVSQKPSSRSEGLCRKRLLPQKEKKKKQDKTVNKIKSSTPNRKKTESGLNTEKGTKSRNKRLIIHSNNSKKLKKPLAHPGAVPKVKKNSTVSSVSRSKGKSKLAEASLPKAHKGAVNRKKAQVQRRMVLKVAGVHGRNKSTKAVRLVKVLSQQTKVASNTGRTQKKLKVVAKKSSVPLARKRGKELKSVQAKRIKRSNAN